MLLNIKKKYIYFAIIVAFVLFAGYFGTQQKTPVFETGKVVRTDLVYEVSVTGRVEPAKSVTLAFEKGGRVGAVYAEVGDFVKQGQAIVVLSNSDMVAQLDQAKATLVAEEAVLADLISGSRPEEKAIYESKVLQAKNAVMDAEIGFKNKILDAFIKTEDAVRNKTDVMFSNPLISSVQFSLTTQYSQKKILLETKRPELEKMLNNWSDSQNSFTNTGDAVSFSDTAENVLNEVLQYLENLAFIVNNLSATSNLSQTTLDTYKSNVSTARTNVSTALTNLLTASNTLNSYKSALVIAENELLLNNAGASKESLDAERARVASARANVDNFTAQLSKTFIISPISGTITEQHAKVGEILTSGLPVVSIISSSHFEVTTNIPEADISRITLGDIASITLDSYGDSVVFPAVITKIDPGETILQGVATYKTTLSFVKQDDRLRPGMTANVNILTEEKNGVLAISTRSIIQNSEGLPSVRVANSEGGFDLVPIVTGMRGSSGQTEVISGLDEGQEIILLVNS